MLLLVHKWRSEEDGIMIGTNTAYYDNPRLNVRDWSGRNPVRIVLDKNLRLSSKLFLFDKTQPSLCYNSYLNKKDSHTEWIQVEENFFSNVLLDLYQRNIRSIIVEGGAMLINFIIQNRLWNEARIFKSPQLFGSGIKAPQLNCFMPDTSWSVDDDNLEIYYN